MTDKSTIWMRNPATGATQEMQPRETVRRAILLQAGWIEVQADTVHDVHNVHDVHPDNPVHPDGTTIKINDDLVVLPAGAEPTARPGHKLVDVTGHDSAIPEFIEVPDETPKRKRSK